MKSLFVSYSNVSDPDQGSGTWYNLYQNLKDYNPNIQAISLNAYPSHWVSKGIKKIHQILGLPYKRYTDVFYLRWAMKRIIRLEDVKEVEVLYTNDWGIAWQAARLGVGQKVLLYTDVYIDFSKSKSEQTDLARRAESWYSYLCLRHYIKKVLRSEAARIFLPSKDLIQAVKHGNSISAPMIEMPFGANNPNSGSVNVTDKFRDVKDSPRFLFIGKDLQRKRLDFAIEVFNLVKSKFPNAELHVVGPRETEFRKFCAMKGINDPSQVKNHGFLSRKSNDDSKLLDALFRASHFYLFPSLSEGYNISILEAKSYGLVTLGCDVIGVRGPVEHGHTGVLLNPNDQKERWKESITSLIKNDRKIEMYSRNACESYLDHHVWSKISEKIYNNNVEL